MIDISETINKAFDLSYLHFSEGPKTDLQSVTILGGGTAGYLAALALRKYHPDMRVSLVESSAIPVIGVGESTTSEIVPFLHRMLDLDPVEFFREVKPTLKLGIRFDWGEPGEKPFNFNFFAGHQHESYYFENSIENANWPSVLMNEKKMPALDGGENGLLSLLSSIPFAYHIDNKNLIRFLRKSVVSSGVDIIDAEVEKIDLSGLNHVEGLQTKCGRKIESDFYIDCSGFRSKILGDALKTPFKSFKSSLITDKALAFELPNGGVIDGYTSAITMNSGWCWKIPMRNEDHYGYVFSSDFCDEESALVEVREKFGDVKGTRLINFRSGRHEKSWNGNVYALGNAFAFIEPLESTAIQTIAQSVMALCRLMPNSLQDQSSIDGLNSEINASWDTFRWFLAIHYKYNRKLETPFWKHCREKTNIGDAKDIVRLFKERAPLVAGNFGTGSAFGYNAFESLVFNTYAYDTLLFGMKETGKIRPPLMSREEYEEKVKSYLDLAEVAMTQRQFFENDFWFESGIIEQLFQDHDSWINETTV